MADVTITQLTSIGAGLDAADEVPVWDVSGAVSRKTTVAQILSGMAPFYQGSYTPALIYATGQSGTAYSLQAGTVLRLGGLCIAVGRISLSAVGAGSGAVTLSLPYALSGSAAAAALAAGSMGAGVSSLQGQAAAAVITLYKNLPSSAFQLLQVSDLTASTTIFFQVAYFTGAPV